MAKKKNHVSVAAWERIAKELCDEGTKTVNWHDEALEIKHRLNLTEVVWFVNQVIKDCFGSDMTEYRPEVKQFAIDRATIAVYTNVTLPVNMEKQYELIIGTDLIEAALCEIDENQYSDLLDAVDEKIDMLIDANIAELNKLTKTVSESANVMNDMMSGVSAGDMDTLLKAISDGKLDEEKLMKAYYAEKAAEAAPVEAEAKNG